VSEWVIYQQRTCYPKRDNDLEDQHAASIEIINTTIMSYNDMNASLHSTTATALIQSSTIIITAANIISYHHTLIGARPPSSANTNKQMRQIHFYSNIHPSNQRMLGMHGMAWHEVVDTPPSSSYHMYGMV
jgi:hypothetical protein